jgi:hypothetical protein
MGQSLVIASIALLALAGVSRAEDTVWLRDGGRVRGAVTPGDDRVTVSWPYGSIEFPSESVGTRPRTEARAGTPIAWTRGDFMLRYRLARTDSAVRAEDLKVSVRNTVHLSRHASVSVARHEDVHRRINETEARRIEEALAAFTYAANPGSESTDALRKAERRLRRRFFRLVRDVEKLHADWDATDPVVR